MDRKKPSPIFTNSFCSRVFFVPRFWPTKGFLNEKFLRRGCVVDSQYCTDFSTNYGRLRGGRQRAVNDISVKLSELSNVELFGKTFHFICNKI